MIVTSEIFTLYNPLGYCNNVRNNGYSIITDDNIGSFNIEDYDKEFSGKEKSTILDSASLQKLNDTINLIKRNDNILNDKDKLFFIQASKFPRTHLSLYTTLKRVIKFEKCTKIAIPESFNTIKLGKCIKIDDNTVIQIPSCLAYTLRTECSDGTRELISQYLPFYKKHEIVEPVIINMSAEEINYMLEFPEKCITSNDLTKYIASNLSTMSFEEYETLDGLLKSADNSVIKMGVKMLNNYNIDVFSDKSSGIYIGMLLLRNYNNLHSGTGTSTTGFKYIEKTLDFSVKKIRSYNEGLYLYKIKSLSKNKEQIEFIDEIIKTYEDNKKIGF